MSNVVSIGTAEADREAIFRKHGITPDGGYVEDADTDNESDD